MQKCMLNLCDWQFSRDLAPCHNVSLSGPLSRATPCASHIPPRYYHPKIFPLWPPIHLHNASDPTTTKNKFPLPENHPFTCNLSAIYSNHTFHSFHSLSYIQKWQLRGLPGWDTYTVWSWVLSWMWLWFSLMCLWWSWTWLWISWIFWKKQKRSVIYSFFFNSFFLLLC